MALDFGNILCLSLMITFLILQFNNVFIFETDSVWEKHKFDLFFIRLVSSRRRADRRWDPKEDHQSYSSKPETN